MRSIDDHHSILFSAIHRRINLRNHTTTIYDDIGKKKMPTMPLKVRFQVAGSSEVIHLSVHSKWLGRNEKCRREKKKKNFHFQINDVWYLPDCQKKRQPGCLFIFFFFFGCCAVVGLVGCLVYLTSFFLFAHR